MKNNEIFTPPYLINGIHRTTINLIGCGGTGSLLLTKLARFHKALNFLEHPGLYVTVIDPDIVEEFNIGRQMFTDGDIGRYKAEVMVSKINYAFGLDWDCHCRKYADDWDANFIISAVDNVRTRKEIHNDFDSHQTSGRDTSKPLYMIDCGNGKDFGQIVLHTHTQGKTVFDLFPDMAKHENREDQGDCGYFQLLEQQDLLINDWVSLYVVTMLKDIFIKKRLDYQGFFFNTYDFQTQKINL